MSEYAGFWLRLVAFILDTFVLSAFDWMLRLLFGGTSDLTLTNIIVGWLYFGLMESSGCQATLGKMALGIHVTDLHGERLSFARATVRHFAKIISGFILLMGYIMAAFTERKQALHDMIAGCLVVRGNQRN